MTETRLDDSLNDDFPVDQIGNAAYAAEFRHQRTLQAAAAGLLLALLASVGANVWLARRPPVVIVIPVDQVGHAAWMRYDTLQYTPREADVRARLHDWAIYRYRLLKDVAGSSFKLNYDYLAGSLAGKLMPQDQTRLAKILAGNEPEQDVQIDNIQFTSLAGRTGEARIELVKIVNPAGESERQPWTVTLKYEVDPGAALERAKHDPGFEYVNPLGVLITWFHEDRAFR